MKTTEQDHNKCRAVTNSEQGDRRRKGRPVRKLSFELEEICSSLP